MKATDLRKRDGSYTPLARKIDKEVGEFLHRLFRKYGKRMEPDSLFVLLSHSVFCESTWQVISHMGERCKKHNRAQKRKEHLVNKAIKTSRGRKTLAKAMMRGTGTSRFQSKVPNISSTPKGKKHGRR